MLLRKKYFLPILWAGILFVLFLVFLFPQIAKTKEVYEGWNTGVQVSSYTVIISDRMKQALDTHAPGFTLWETEDFQKILKLYPFTKYQCPQAIFADFNGDNIGDVVVWGYDKHNTFVIAILSYTRNAGDVDYKAVTVRKGTPASGKSPREEGPGTYLSIYPPQKIESQFDQPPLDLKIAGINITNMNALVSQMYYYKVGKFYVRTTGD